jgi:phage shock protein PspC (stress-responsive transcriptional regulator)
MSEARDLPQAPDVIDAPDLIEAPTENDTHEETIMTNAQQTPLHDVTDAPSPWQDKPAPKKLTRNTSDKMIAGVCSGLADYLNIDVTIVRLGFVALTIVTGGVGAIAYAAGWIVVPERRF